MQRLICKEERKRLGENAKHAGEQFLWEARGIEYRDLLKNKCFQI